MILPLAVVAAVLPVMVAVVAALATVPVLGIAGSGAADFSPPVFLIAILIVLPVLILVLILATVLDFVPVPNLPLLVTSSRRAARPLAGRMEGTLAAEAGTVAAHTTAHTAAAHAAAAGERYSRYSQTQSGCKKHDQKCSVFHGSFSPFLISSVSNQ